MINKTMDKITLYKIENKFGDDRYLVSSEPVSDGEALADYNNIEELYPSVVTTDTTIQNYLATETFNLASANIAACNTFTDTRAAVGVLNSAYQAGAGNSQYGTQWIYSDEDKQSKKIRVTDDIPDGWTKGRKIKFEEDKDE